MSDQSVNAQHDPNKRLEDTLGPWLPQLKAWGVAPEAVIDPAHPQHNHQQAQIVRNEMLDRSNARRRAEHQAQRANRRELRAIRRRASGGIIAWCRLPGEPGSPPAIEDRHREQLASELDRAGCDPVLTLFDEPRWLSDPGEWRLQARGWKRAEVENEW